MKRDVEALWVEPDDIRPMKGQPRIFFDQKELDALEASMEIEQEQDLHVIRIPGATSKPHFELNDGERRWRTALKSNRKLKVIVDPPETEIDRYERAVRSNVKVELSPYEKILACARLKRERKYSPVEIGKRIAINPVSVQIYLHIAEDLSPDVLELLRPDRPPNERLRVMVAYQLSRYNHAEQKRMARDMLGMGERQAVTFIRAKARRGLLNPVTIATRKRKPSDDYYTFSAALERTLTGVVSYLEMDRVFFTTMLGNRSRDEIRKNIGDIDAAMSALTKIKDKIQKAQT